MRWTFTAEWGVFIGTLVLAVVTWFLYCATRDLVNGADASAKMDLRAYVSFEVQDLGLLSPEYPVWIKFRLTNFGKSPARFVDNVTVVKVLPSPLPRDFQFPFPPKRKDRSPFVLHPTQTRDSKKQADQPPTAEEIEALRSDHSALYFYGVIGYRDIFDLPHTTTYCIFVKRV